MSKLPTFFIKENSQGRFEVYRILYASEIDYILYKTFENLAEAQQYVEERE